MTNHHKDSEADIDIMEALMVRAMEQKLIDLNLVIDRRIDLEEMVYRDRNNQVANLDDGDS